MQPSNWIMKPQVFLEGNTRGLSVLSHTTAFRSGGELSSQLQRGKGRVKSFARLIGLRALNFRSV